MTLIDSKNITSETMLGLIWVSTILAMIFVLPALGLFYIVYEISENLLVSIIAGAILHFTMFALSPKISSRLTSWLGKTQPSDGAAK